MATRLDSRLVRLRARRSDPTQKLYYHNELLEKAERTFDVSKKAKEYVSASMAEMEPNYTQKTIEERQRVQDQIAEACRTASFPVVFRYQGSVTNNTHVKTHSDVDLLVICDKFITLKKPLEPTSPYQGDPMADLRELRSLIEMRLSGSFPQASVDKSGAKAVTISGGSLARKIDVIPSNWYDTVEYRQKGAEDYRGIQVYDKTPPGSRIENFPFLHNLLLNAKDRDTFGGLKRLIRFVKSVKYDADQDPGVSSYDIAALCFNVPTETLRQSAGDDLSLVNSFLAFSQFILSDTVARESLWVPNKTRPLFGDSGISIGALRKLNEEVAEVLSDSGRLGR